MCRYCVNHVILYFCISILSSPVFKNVPFLLLLPMSICFLIRIVLCPVVVLWGTSLFPPSVSAMTQSWRSHLSIWRSDLQNSKNKKEGFIFIHATRSVNKPYSRNFVFPLFSQLNFILNSLRLRTIQCTKGFEGLRVMCWWMRINTWIREVGWQ